VTRDSFETTQSLIGLWRNILQVEVGPKDSFFDLGGDSISAIRMLGRASEWLGGRIAFGRFRKDPTIEGMISAAKDFGERTSLPSSPGPMAAADRFPISRQQVAAWFAHRMEPGSRAYLAESTTTFTGSLDTKALERAIGRIYARHDAYRTVFEERDGVPVQVVRPEGVLDLRHLDGRHVAEDEREAFIQEHLRTTLPLISDLAHLPLCNFLLITFAEDRHVLVHREHHIIHDGWSSSEFTRELIELYREETEPGYEARLLPPASYADFVREQDDWLKGPEAAAQRDYWHQRLKNAPEGVPLFGVRAAKSSYAGAHLRTVHTREEWTRFEDAARRLEVTPFTLFAALFFVCLWRYSGERDLALGSAFAARGLPCSDRVLGMFVNTVVLTQKIDAAITFSDLVRQVDTTVQEALDNQDYPFVSLVEEMRSERSRSGTNPFANVMLGFHDTPIDADAPTGLSVFKDETVTSESTKFDLTALVVHRARHGNESGMVNVLWEYRPDLYKEWQVAAITGAMAELVRTAGNDPDRLAARKLARLGVVPAELADTTARAAQGAVRPDFPRADFSAAVLRHAQAAPDRVALQDEAGTLAYGRLAAAMTGLAEEFRRAVPDMSGSIGITWPRSRELVVAMLAAVHARVPFVILDTSLPAARFDFIGEDAGIAALVGPCDTLPAGSALSGLPRLAADLQGVREEPLPLAETPAGSGLAYIGYTSGSTGRPKGVEVTRDALFNVVSWLAEEFATTPNSTATAVVTPGFDAFMSEVWPVLLGGGRLILVPDEVRKDLDAFARLLANEHVTNAFLPTGLFREFMRGGFPLPEGLATISAGGEAISDLKLPPTFGGRFYNLYGPTETTVLSTASSYASPGADAVTIGRPIANTRVSVVDPDGLPCPPGLPGELLIKGTGVAAGYRNLAEETGRKFRREGGDGAAAYATGDRVCWNADGELEYLGRLDDEMKIRGFRVAPQEIIRILEAAPEVARGIVAIRDEALVAYVVRQQTAEANGVSDGGLARQLRREIKANLPDYMVPQAIVVLAALPLTDRGKVDTARLPSPFTAPAAPATVAPASETETELLTIWEEILARPVGSVAANFFAVGGHSMLAMRVLTRMRERWGVSLEMRDFFQNGTVRAQADLVDKHRTTAGSDLMEVEEGTI